MLYFLYSKGGVIERFVDTDTQETESLMEMKGSEEEKKEQVSIGRENL